MKLIKSETINDEQQFTPHDQFYSEISTNTTALPTTGYEFNRFVLIERTWNVLVQHVLYEQKQPRHLVELHIYLYEIIFQIYFRIPLFSNCEN